MTSTKTKRVMLRLTPEQHQKLQIVASQQYRSVSGVILAALDTLLKDVKLPTAPAPNVWTASDASPKPAHNPLFVGGPRNGDETFSRINRTWDEEKKEYV